MTKNISMPLWDHFEGFSNQQIESVCCGSAGEVVGPNQQLLEEHERKVAALRQALLDGENSGEADELDIKKIKAKARQRSNR